MKQLTTNLCLAISLCCVLFIAWRGLMVPSDHQVGNGSEMVQTPIDQPGVPSSGVRVVSHDDPVQYGGAQYPATGLPPVTAQHIVPSSYTDSISSDEDLLRTPSGEPFDPGIINPQMPLADDIPRPKPLPPKPLPPKPSPPATMSAPEPQPNPFDSTLRTDPISAPQQSISSSQAPDYAPTQPAPSLEGFEPLPDPNTPHPVDSMAEDMLSGADNAELDPPSPQVVEDAGEDMLPSTNVATEPETQITAPESSGWSKDTPPSSDEDLLQNMQLDQPNQSNTNDASNSAASGKSRSSSTDSRSSNPHSSSAKKTADWPEGVDPHADLYAETMYPSAKNCRKCHEEIYDEWAGSSHAYASISPMFHKFEQTIHALTQGTISYFCYRCHAPVATSIGHPREASIWDSVPSATEGVTCIACHRVKEEYGKVNGERRIETGSLYDPVYGSGYGEGLAEVLANKSRYKVKTDPGEKGPGQDIHGKVIHFEQISSSHFCVSCHQVAVVPGIALEVVWAQYRASPACKQGITCQECHMGSEPGVAAGYDTGPVAIVNDIGISPHRKHSNHTFYGPGYSIAHPGIFPFNPKADDWTVRQWMEFDYRAGWGTEEFEKAVEDEKVQVNFPEIWEESDDRMDAREIVEENLGKLEAKRQMRHRLMENGSEVHGPVFKKQPQVGRPLAFHYSVTNKNLGHNMPSGSLGAQPQVWLNVALTGPNGQHLWESGYVDANGDIADVHSLEVAAGRIRRDLQLFNLQTKFLITHVKGTDREMYLPIPTDIDQLPFIRQSGFPITVLNHPPFIRMEAHSLPPLGTRNAKYKVPAKLMKQPGVYRLSVRMRSRAEPIYFMRFCKATPEMERMMNEWMLDYHEEAFEFYVAGPGDGANAPGIRQAKGPIRRKLKR